MMETVLRNWIVAAIITMALLLLLWYPDFAGYNPASVSFLLPCTGTAYEGSLYDSTGYRLLTIFMAVVNGLVLLILSLRYLSLGRANAILPLCYLLIIFSFPQARAFSSAYPAALLTLLGLFSLFKAGEVKKPMAPLFLSTFFAGCACLLYLPSLVIILSFIAIAITLHLFYGRNILVFWGGIILTLGGCLFSRYLFLGEIEMPYNTTFTLHLKIAPATPAGLFMAVFFFYLFIRAITRWLRCAFGDQTYRNRTLAAFIWMCIICGAPLLLFTDQAFGYLPLFAVPASILLTYYFSGERLTNRMKVEFIVLLLAIALNQVAYFM